MEPTTTITIDQLLANRRTILATRHWRAVPALRAELTATNRAIRTLSAAKAIKQTPAQSAPAPIPPRHRIETGDTVRDLTPKQLGIGQVVGLNWSTHFGLQYQVRFESATEWRFSRDVEYVAQEDAR